MSQRAPSRTLPIVVGAGVALGVFGGLMLIRGPSSAGPDDGQPEILEPAGEDTAGAGDTPEGDNVGDNVGDDIAAAGSSDAGVEMVAVTFDAAPEVVEPTVTPVSLSFDVTPDDAEIEIDGEPLSDDGRFEIELTEGERASVEVVAKATGYKAYSKQVKLSPEDGDKTIEIKLEKIVKKPTKRRPPRRNSGRRNNRPRRGSGGLIDL
ncbi:MAG: hypothetical protein Tsb0020_04820 [Haliangiales bacterium]